MRIRNFKYSPKENKALLLCDFLTLTESIRILESI